MNLSLQVVENQAHSRSKKLVKKLRSFPCSTIPQNWLNVFIAMKATEGGSSNIYLPSQFYECQVPGWKAGSIIAYDLWDGTPLASDPQAPDHQSHNDYLVFMSLFFSPVTQMYTMFHIKSLKYRKGTWTLICFSKFINDFPVKPIVCKLILIKLQTFISLFFSRNLNIICFKI